MAQMECTSSLNFEHLEYKFQVPADSLIQYLYCFSVAHKESCTKNFYSTLPFMLTTETRGYYSVVHIVTTTKLEMTHTRSTVYIQVIDLKLGCRSNSRF